MRIIKIKVDEKSGGTSCLNILPKEFIDYGPGLSIELIQCAGPTMGRGSAMFKINDPKGLLSSVVEDSMVGSNELGTFNIQRISKKQMVAIVNNQSCTFAKTVSDCGCFMTTSERDERGNFVCSILGNDESLRNMIRHMREDHYNLEILATYNMDFGFTLAPMQEKAIRAALENGYYEIPKKVDIRELCKIVGISRSTFDINLRIAEKKIITGFFDMNAPLSEK